jgi:lactate permease
VRAVILPSVGHGWSVTFGSLGIAFVMLSQLSDIPASRLAPLTAFMLGVLCLISGLMVAHAAAGWGGIRQAWVFVLVVGLVMSATQYALALAGLYTLSAVGASLGGLVAAAGWIRWRSMGQTTPPQGSMSIHMALVGYAVLVLLALITGAITPVKSFLAQWAVAIDLPATETGRGWASRAASQGFAVPGHPGMVILYSAIIAYLLYRKLYQPGATRRILVQSGRGALRALAGVLVMIAMAATMTYAGMIHVLACGMSQNIPGGLYAFVAALIGALGAVVTGSNVNSNAIFTGLQRSTADGLGLSPVIILAAQTASASVGSFFSPAKVAVGCSTVGANEGVVLRTLLAYGAILVLTVGVMAWIALLLV